MIDPIYGEICRERRVSFYVLLWGLFMAHNRTMAHAVTYDSKSIGRANKPAHQRCCERESVSPSYSHRRPLGLAGDSGISPPVVHPISLLPTVPSFSV